MENSTDSSKSLPYIDDISTDEDTSAHQYNLKIIENYQKRNRNIEITNRCPKDAPKSLNPVAPLADENEFSDTPDENIRVRKLPSKESGMKVVINGWNSSISIQGLDNASSITFKRKCERKHKKADRSEERKHASEEGKPEEKSRKGKWKMLTRSIMLARSARFERRGLDERYPKYVLLKNEEEEMTSVKENYPKMFIFSDKGEKQKRTADPKPEFSFKKSFKNKTEPVMPLDEIIGKTEEVQPEQSKRKPDENIKKQKKPLTERNVTIKKKIVVERRKSLTTEKPAAHQPQVEESQGQVYTEIQGIFEDALKLCPQGLSDVQQQQERSQQGEYYCPLPPFCQFSCHDPYCLHGHPPKYEAACNPHKGHTYNSSIPQTKCEDQEMLAQEHSERDIELGNLPFGILSSFFPRVVIMNAIRSEGRRSQEEVIDTANETDFRNYEQPPKTEGTKDEMKSNATLEIPQQDLTLKSKIVRDVIKPEVEDLSVGDDSLKEFPGFSEDRKTKSQESVATEYLNYSEPEPQENESIDPSKPPPPPQNDSKQEKEDKSLTWVDKFKTEDPDGNSENLSLTKIGYKMYDNLTKLSLNREKEITKKSEVSGCGCNGSGTKKSPYNITLESNNSVVKVTVPENELNFQIVNSEGGQIHIGILKNGEGEEKKLVRREELWHFDGDRKAMILKKEARPDADSKGFQKLKFSLADSGETLLSIEMNGKDGDENKMKDRSTKEMKVGTDDLDVAGGDFVCAQEGKSKNLSPRLGQLLKHLHEKLETDERERKFLNEKINQKLIDQKFQGGVLPGVFLVKHISPRRPAVSKPAEVSSSRKAEKSEGQGQLREYYCEECLATMRIFEDENPSVKSIVDKFETIIQLESY